MRKKWYLKNSSVILFASMKEIAFIMENDIARSRLTDKEWKMQDSYYSTLLQLAAPFILFLLQVWFRYTSICFYLFIILFTLYHK